MGDFLRYILNRDLPRETIDRFVAGDPCICLLSTVVPVIEGGMPELRATRLENERRFGSFVESSRPIDVAEWVNWCEGEIRGGKLTAPCWRDSLWRTHLRTYLGVVQKAWDSTMKETKWEKLVPNYFEQWDWVGGVRMFDWSMRLPMDEEKANAYDAPLSGGPYRNLPYVLGVGPVKGLDGRITGAGLDLLKTMRTEAGIRFKMRQEEMALAMYLTVAAGDPTDAASWTNSALVRLKLSRDDEDDENTMTNIGAAIADCTMALYYDPTNVKALQRRGHALMLLDMLEKAQVDLEEAHRLDPENYSAKHDLDLCREYNALQERMLMLIYLDKPDPSIQRKMNSLLSVIQQS